MFPKIDEMTKTTKNKFLLSNAVAQRAKEIADGTILSMNETSFKNNIEFEFTSAEYRSTPSPHDPPLLTYALLRNVEEGTPFFRSFADLDLIL